MSHAIFMYSFLKSPTTIIQLILSVKFELQKRLNSPTTFVRFRNRYLNIILMIKYIFTKLGLHLSKGLHCSKCGYDFPIGFDGWFFVNRMCARTNNNNNI